MHLYIPPDQVKNSIDLEIPLGKFTTDLANTYMTIYQSIMPCGHDTDLLFPGMAGYPKASSGFSKQITDVIFEKTGIQMNLHLFRHLGAFLFLTAHPGEYETVRRFLGHKSIQTTIKFYVGLERAAAFRRYDEVVLKLRTARDSENRGMKG
jgi:site-specific recombinase XerD